MSLKNDFAISDSGRQRLEEVYARYRQLYESPDTCLPMIIINTPIPNLPCWEDRLADPLVMLRAELDSLQPHLEIGDDRVPTVRVQFGTAQVAVAFGCKMFFPPNNPPAAGSHVLSDIEKVYDLKKPALNAGWYGKLAKWTKLWQTHLPAGIYMQHPDIQSAFNSAHLIRGNDILMDFYDCPDKLGALLDIVTDFMIDITRHVKDMISHDSEWFFDWGALWKGFARISNCSTHMISPDFYMEHVLPRDIRFFEAIGGGRVHYCGTAGGVIDEFFKAPLITGLDFDLKYHDFFDICDRSPHNVVLIPTGACDKDSVLLQRLLKGDWPKKRNIIIQTYAPSVKEGKLLLDQLKKSVPYNM